MTVSRRRFLKTGTYAAAATITGGHLPACAGNIGKTNHQHFQISLAEWSLHRTLRQGKLDNLRFPQYAKDTFGIRAVEYVNAFFKQHAKDKTYLKDLKSRTDSEGIRNVLIMCDGEGLLGTSSGKARAKTVDNHKKWVEAARFLGCHSIRVNAAGPGTREELAKRVTESLQALSSFAKDMDINITVENHGGFSSDGAWLAGVLKAVHMPNCGSLPDFGNFYNYDRYQGLTDLMPFAKGVSAKSRRFDDHGNELETDFLKAMKIVAASGYKGYIGIEYEGRKLTEDQGIIATKKLLDRVLRQL